MDSTQPTLALDKKPDLSTWPRVTFVLETTGIADFSRIPNGDFYKQRGADVHMICESIDKGEPDYWSDGPLAGYAAAWKKFRDETHFKPALIEHPVYNETRRYKGTLDRTGHFADKTKLVLLDIKVGIVADWVKLQTAAYAACLLQPETIQRHGLRLRQDGTYNLTDAYPDYRTDAAMFFSLVNTVHGRSLYGRMEFESLGELD